MLLNSSVDEAHQLQWNHSCFANIGLVNWEFLIFWSKYFWWQYEVTDELQKNSANRETMQLLQKIVLFCIDHNIGVQTDGISTQTISWLICYYMVNIPKLLTSILIYGKQRLNLRSPWGRVYKISLEQVPTRLLWYSLALSKQKTYTTITICYTKNCAFFLKKRFLLR